MANGSLNFNGYHNSIEIETDNVSGGGGNHAPILQVPVRLEINVPRETYAVELMSVKAELFAFGKTIRIAETTQLLAFTIREKRDYNIYFQFAMSESSLNQIEKQRKDNPNFLIECTLQVGYYESLNVTGPKNELLTKSFLSSIQTGSGQINFTVEQSKWVNTMLAQFGNKKTKIIEIPLYNNLIPEEFKLSLHEFEVAQEYFIKGDYDATVAHCRAALDPFNTKVKLEKLKAYIKSKSEFEWAIDIAEATETFLEKVIKSTSRFTSKAHHAPSTGHFTRVDAEIIMMVTTGVVAYIGKIEYKSE